MLQVLTMFKMCQVVCANATFVIAADGDAVASSAS